MSWRDFFPLGQWLDHPCRNTELDPIPLRPAPHVANIQTYKHLNKSKSEDWAYVSNENFYWDKLMTSQFLFLANQGKILQI